MSAISCWMRGVASSSRSSARAVCRNTGSPTCTMGSLAMPRTIIEAGARRSTGALLLAGPRAARALDARPRAHQLSGLVGKILGFARAQPGEVDDVNLAVAQPFRHAELALRSACHGSAVTRKIGRAHV